MLFSVSRLQLWEGGFFKKHQDTEKATFIVHLPSVYEGGELDLQFKGDKQTVDSSVGPRHRCRPEDSHNQEGLS